MRILTIIQPWATLIASGHKRIETRSWSTRYRGALAIHAGAGWPYYAQMFAEPLIQSGNIPRDLPLGAIVAVATVVGCHRAEDIPLSPLERSLGDYAAGRYGWMLSDVRPLVRPLTYKGSQGLRTLPDVVALRVLALAET